jgi:glutamate synthase domain-containing protein 2
VRNFLFNCWILEAPRAKRGFFFAFFYGSGAGVGPHQLFYESDVGLKFASKFIAAFGLNISIQITNDISMRKYFILGLVPIYALIFLLAHYLNSVFYSLFIFLIPLTLLGLYDIIQTRHTLLRNYPVVGHVRYLLEMIRPEIQQYFIEKDIDGRPFSRDQRSVIYQRAKGELDSAPFGTQLHLYQTGAEWLEHTLNKSVQLENDPRVIIGNHQCKKPYSSSRYNISAMSYGSISKNAVIALNRAAKSGNFSHNTGEGGLSPYHLEGGGDLVWQIGTGYFGCRNHDGTFNEGLFKDKSKLDNVKMIEIKLSQGAKPGHGGILPAVKVTDEIVRIRHVQKGNDVISPPWHSEFSTPLELMDFIQRLRNFSGGKPVGIKLCIGKKSEFVSVCKAMIEKDVYPDFITIDGAEGGTGASPREFTNHMGTPLDDGLNFAHNVLKGFGIRHLVKIIAAGKVIDGFSIITKFALGADICNCARGMMMALGCIQALRCNTNQCPTGVATQDPELYKLLDVEDKSKRVAQFHRRTIAQVRDLVNAMGVSKIEDIHKSHIKRRVSVGEICSYDELFKTVEENSFTNPELVPHDFKKCISEASTERF